jgi:hypothetical protein
MGMAEDTVEGMAEDMAEGMEIIINPDVLIREKKMNLKPFVNSSGFL